MFKMFTRFFAMLETLFGAGEKLAKAGDHMAEWAEETAGAFKDEAKISRVAKRKALLNQAGVTEEDLAAAQVPTAE